MTLQRRPLKPRHFVVSRAILARVLYLKQEQFTFTMPRALSAVAGCLHQILLELGDFSKT